MRLFNDKENKLLKKIVEYKQSGNLKELQVAPLLRKNLSVLALVWTISPKPTVKVYSISEDFDEAMHHYLSVVDFIYFIQELERIGFIRLVSIPNSKAEPIRELYDRVKYDFISDKNQFVEKGLDKDNGILSLMSDFDCNLFGKTDNAEYISPLTIQTIPNSFAIELDNVVYKIIYPMPILESYVKSGFKTLEDKRFEENLNLSRVSLIQSNRTLWISSVACFVSIVAAAIAAYFGYKQLQSPSHIEDEQLRHLESVIEQSNQMFTPLEVATSDTLKVKIINYPSKR